MTEKLEFRSSKFQVNEPELKEDEKDNELVVEGKVNVPGEKSEKLTQDGITFTESVQEGAFAKALEQADDIKLLKEHDPKELLARKKNGSLEIEEKDGEVRFKAKLPDTQFGRDAHHIVKESLYDSMSFGFRALSDKWDTTVNPPHRTITDLELFEISIVADPAYSQSHVEARNITIPQTKQIEEKEVIQPMATLQTAPKKEVRSITDKTAELLDISQAELETRALTNATTGETLNTKQKLAPIVETPVTVSPILANAERIASDENKVEIIREVSFPEAQTLEELAEGVFADPTFETNEVKLTEKQVTVVVSRSQVSDADGKLQLPSYVDRRMTEQLDRREVAEAVLGIVADKDVEKFTVATALTANDAEQKVIDMMYDLDPEAQLNAAVYGNKSMQTLFGSIKLADGTRLLQNGNVNGKLQATVAGMPFYLTPELPETQPLIVGDMYHGLVHVTQREVDLERIDGDTVNRLKRTVTFDGVKRSGTAVKRPSSIKVLEITE